jgi:hypothetical protein
MPSKPASPIERPDIGGDVGDLAARQIHVRHFWMRIVRKAERAFADFFFAIAAKLGASELARV